MSSQHPKSSPKRKIGFWLSTSLVIGNMTGSGIFLLPAALAVYGGISLFGWLFTTLGAFLLAIVFSRLSRKITKAGGPYAFAQVAFGDFAGFIVTWGYWVSIWCGNAAIAVAGVGYLSYFFPVLKSEPVLSALLSIAFVWLFTLVNTYPIRKVGMVQLITTIFKLIPLLLLGTLGFLYFTPEHFSPLNISGSGNFKAITATAALTLWAFMGLESATVPSDKVINPTKTIPRATLTGIAVAALIFIASTMGVMGIIDPHSLQNSSAPFADAANQAWGQWGGYLVAAGAAIACFGALNGWILIQGQLPLAAARDKLFPATFRKVSKKGIPVVGLVISSILSTLLVGMNYTRGLVDMFAFMIMLATLTCLLPYLVATLAELALYLKKKQTYSRSQLWKVLLISIPALAFSTWAVVGLGWTVNAWGFILLLLGVPLFLNLKSKRKAT